jgi:hypothetical protein
MARAGVKGAIRRRRVCSWLKGKETNLCALSPAGYPCCPAVICLIHTHKRPTPVEVGTSRCKIFATFHQPFVPFSENLIAGWMFMIKRLVTLLGRQRHDRTHTLPRPCGPARGFVAHGTARRSNVASEKRYDVRTRVVMVAMRSECQREEPMVATRLCDIVQCVLLVVVTTFGAVRCIRVCNLHLTCEG